MIPGFCPDHRHLSVAVTLCILLITLAPFCGWVFHCGCIWPWAGLDRYCNFYDNNQKDHCPWCTSFVFGYLITALLIFISGFVTWHCSNLITVTKQRSGAFISIAAGLLVFYCLSVINAGIAATIMEYPYFIFKIWSFF